MHTLLKETDMQKKGRAVTSEQMKQKEKSPSPQSVFDNSDSLARGCQLIMRLDFFLASRASGKVVCV